MIKYFYDLGDTGLRSWSANFSAVLSQSPERFGVSPQAAADYEALDATYAVALTDWLSPSTGTSVALQGKKAAREQLLSMAKYLVRSINTNPATLDTQRDELGIRGRRQRITVGVPLFAPKVDVLSVDGRVATIGLRDTYVGRRKRPTGIAGARVYTFMGEESPTEVSDWKLFGLVSATRFRIDFNTSTTAGTAWVTVNWYNRHGQTGPSSRVVGINLPAGLVVPTTRIARIAA